MNPSLYTHITKHISLSEADMNLIGHAFIEKRIKRKEILLYEDAPCSKLFFVVDGLLRAYRYNEDDKEITIMFAKQDWWITDMNSFVNQSASTVTIEALKDSTVLSIRYTSLQELYNRVPGFNQLWRILMQNAYCRAQQRVVRILTMPASSRYQLFLQKYPEVASLVTQRQIASYLGITPEFLSTLKSNLKVP